MKHNQLYAFCIALITGVLAGNQLSAQGVAVNATGAAADTSAMLDVSSTTKGVLVPRMTAVQRMAIHLPATGLLVYQTDGSTPGYYYYTGTNWNPIGFGDDGFEGSIPVFTGTFSIGNSIIYQSPAAGHRLTINGGSPHGLVSVNSNTDTVALYIKQHASPSSFSSGSEFIGGVIRVEYDGPNDNLRTGVYSNMVRSGSDQNGVGVLGAGNSTGVYGIGESSASGITTYGVKGFSLGSGDYSVGVYGGATNLIGTPSNCYGVYGEASGGTNNYGGYFSGDVRVVGALSKGSGTFEIDHPLDPENKYLYHSFVESPDMMNIYNGNITTDASGEATVKMPDYFQALNKDFRYQLTVIGATFAQAIVTQEITGNSFEIKTNQPNIKVSWMVTGVRHDAYANAHRIVPEVEKAPHDKGKYLYPKEMGQPAELGIGADLKQIGRASCRDRVYVLV